MSFGRTLATTRAAAGFKTAYAFYHANGGRHGFPFTYAYYAKIERGQSLPRPAWLAKIVTALRILGSVQRSALVRAYLRDWTDDEDAFDSLFTPLLIGASESASRRALRALRVRNSHHFTPDELRTICSSRAAIATITFLTNSPGSVDIDAIARWTGLSEKECSAALESLCRHRLTRRVSRGRYSLARPGTCFTVPEDSYTKKVREDGQSRLAEFLRGRSKLVFDRIDSFRLDRASLDSLRGSLQESFDLATGLSRWNEADISESPIHMVEVKIRRLG